MLLAAFGEFKIFTTLSLVCSEQLLDTQEELPIILIMRQVCSGTTGHAEAVLVEFDSTVVTFETLLNEFWSIHDPTTLNRQGPDIGTQYRSAIFYTDQHQKQIAEQSKLNMNKNKFNGKIVTEINKFSTFFKAEEYHQHYNKKLKQKYGIS